MPDIKIADHNISNVWKCMRVDCDNCEEVVVHPDYYQENGTPVCTECDTDMDYSHTIVTIPDADFSLDLPTE